MHESERTGNQVSVTEAVKARKKKGSNRGIRRHIMYVCIVQLRDHRAAIAPLFGERGSSGCGDVGLSGRHLSRTGSTAIPFPILRPAPGRQNRSSYLRPGQGTRQPSDPWEVVRWARHLRGGKESSVLLQDSQHCDSEISAGWSSSKRKILTKSAKVKHGGLSKLDKS